MSEIKKLKLIVSDVKPAGISKAHEVHVTLVDEHLRAAKPIASRLCGGTTTCMAIMDTD
jgi:hypothetical protein